MSKILVVEDSPVQAEFLRYTLEAKGFQVQIAGDGSQGLECFLAGDFDLVLSDILMPGLSGYELCRHIKDCPAKKPTPVILLTSLNDPLAIVQGMECGADNYLPKPYRPDVLLARIRHALANKTSVQDTGAKVEVTFLGKSFTIRSGMEQILDLLISTCEDIVRTNQDLQASRDELAAAKARIEEYARGVEGQARSSEDRYRRLMEQANDAIFVLDEAGKVMEVNRRAEELLGRPGPELVDCPFESFLPTGERDNERRRLQRLLADGRIRGKDLHFLGADGRQMDVSYSASLASLDGEPVILTIVHDEEALRERERRFQAIFNHTFEQVALLGVDGTLLEVNQPALDFRHLACTDVVGRPLWENPWLDSSAATRQQLQSAVAEAAAGRLAREEVAVSGPDGGLRTFDFSVQPILDEARGVNLLIAEARDVTERKRLQDRLHQSQKLEAVGRLAGGVAHDFNNLLTVINGFSELMLQQMSSDHPFRESINQITKAADRAAALNRQLLTFSRKAIIEPRVLDLKDLVGDMERLLRRIIGEDIELTTVTEHSLGRIKADPSHMEQVILNLAVNARDAMPQGGKLTIELRNIELDNAYTRSHPDAPAGRYVLLAVTDTGVGMDRATQARIWEPFFTTKGEAGTGLGLATVYGVVRQSGGHVAVYSEPGLGATFKVYLPLVQDKVETAKSPKDPVAIPPGKEIILLVEDEDGVRSLAKRVLAGCGYRVLEADNGQEALKVASRHRERIDLVVTDVVMPRLGGREVVERLAKRYPGIRVLFLSGYTDDAVVRHGVLEAEVQFLHKPFSPAALARKVREVLDR